MALHLITISALTVALVWKGHQLTRAPKDRALQAVVGSLTAMLAANVVGLGPVARWIDDVVAAGAATIVENILLALGLFQLMLVFQYRAGARKRNMADLAALVGVVLALVVTMLAAPPAARGATFATADLGVAPIAVFYAVGIGYFAYLLAGSARWSWRYAHRADQPVVPRLAWGLRLAAVGFSGLAAASTVRTGAVVLRWSGGETPDVVVLAEIALLVSSVVLLAAGLVYPSAVARASAMRRWQRDRWAYGELSTLHRLLRQPFPRHVLRLRSQRAKEDEDSVLFRAGLWHERRRTECRDGLVSISSHMHKFADGDILAHGSAAVLAPVLHQGLRAHEQGEPASTTPVPVALPTEATVDAETDRLVELSQELERLDRKGKQR